MDCEEFLEFCASHDADFVDDLLTRISDEDPSLVSAQ